MRGAGRHKKRPPTPTPTLPGQEGDCLPRPPARGKADGAHLRHLRQLYRIVRAARRYRVRVGFGRRPARIAGSSRDGGVARNRAWTASRPFSFFLLSPSSRCARHSRVASTPMVSFSSIFLLSSHRRWTGTDPRAIFPGGGGGGGGEKRIRAGHTTRGGAVGRGFFFFVTAAATPTNPAPLCCPCKEAVYTLLTMGKISGGACTKLKGQ
jgi:hypothetical protein